MMNKSNFRKLISIFFSAILIVSGQSYSVLSLDIEKRKSLDIDYLNKKPLNDYILGPGDVLKIAIYRYRPQPTNTYKIDSSGTIFLPEINRVYISGLTLDEINNLLNKKYSELMVSPNITSEIIYYRPVRIYIGGEVDFPGLHTLKGDLNENPTDFSKNGSSINEIQNPLQDEDLTSFQSSSDTLGLFFEDSEKENSNSNNSFPSIPNLKSSYFPTVFDAIRKAGGVTTFSNLSEVQITRRNSISNGGGRIKTTVNFLKVIEDGDSSQNIRIYDGDVIRISKSKDPVLSQINKAIKTNLNPRYVKVFVAGRVNTPGSIITSKSSTLNDAIELAGGTKVIKGKVKFTRFKTDGEIDKRVFSLRRNSKPGSYKNPFLKSGDIIVVDKNIVNAFNEVLTDVTQPITGIYSTVKLLEIIAD